MSTRPKLYIGNRNYSSWSLRPWLFLHEFGVAFEDEVIPLDTPEFRAQVAQVSPTLRVPVLIDGDQHVWDSLAICLYASERWIGPKALPGALPARDFDRDPASYLACDWLAPKWDWVDPAKDARAEIEQIRAGLDGNMCRCTGYQNIVKAVAQGAAAMK